MMTRARMVLLAVTVLLAASLFAVWLARDWPRRKVQSALAAELNADVSLGRFELIGTERFDLHRLEIRSLPTMPYARIVRIERLSVAGNPGEILEGRFSSIEVHSAAVRITVPEKPGTVARDQETG